MDRVEVTETTKQQALYAERVELARLNSDVTGLRSVARAKNIKVSDHDIGLPPSGAGRIRKIASALENKIPGVRGDIYDQMPGIPRQIWRYRSGNSFPGKEKTVSRCPRVLSIF